MGERPEGEKRMIISMQGLVVLAVGYALMRAVIEESPETQSLYRLVGYITFGMLTIEIALLIGAIWV